LRGVAHRHFQPVPLHAVHPADVQHDRGDAIRAAQRLQPRAGQFLKGASQRVFVQTHVFSCSSGPSNCARPSR
jgi:hypothetical protein